MDSSRRAFVKKLSAGSLGLMAGQTLPYFTARSYGRIMGANENINVSVMGVNSRGKALARNFSRQNNCRIMHVCDVDVRAIGNCMKSLQDVQTESPAEYSDFRKSLESMDVDALVVATPDHWHAPAALLAMEAGKHVYLEKPCSHNPSEGEILVKAAERYGKVIQMGNQRRSWPLVMQGIQELKEGIIGRPYFGKSWYSNNRASIGIGKVVPVPDWLDWDLWQGPAPRLPYKDNIVHYNWHWFWHWGTGEALNNGTHMIDLLRWGLGVDYPVRVSSNGGRFRYNDDWETPDTQVINLDFAENVSMTWEGRSCNGKKIEGSSVGALFYGDNGSLLITGENKYTVFDLNGDVVKEIKGNQDVDPRNLTNPSENLDGLHIQNFFEAIRRGVKLNADIGSGHKSTLLVQLGNIAFRTGRSLDIDGQTGRIVKDSDAMQYWARTYENGWEMKL